MGAIDTNYTFTATDVITSTKMNNILDQSTITATAVFNSTLSIASGKLLVATGGVTSNELAANSVTTTAILDSNVTTAKILDANVTTAKIADDAVTSDKIALGAIIPNLPSNFPIQTIQSKLTTTQSVTGSSTAWTDITSLTSTLTRVVASASGKVRVQVVINSSVDNTSNNFPFRILRDGTAIGAGDTAGSRTSASSNGTYPYNDRGNSVVVIDFIDDAPGSNATVTYKVQGRPNTGTIGYVNRTISDTDSVLFTRTISTLTITELTP